MGWEVTLMSAVRALNIFERFDVTRRIDRVKIDNALQTLRQIFFYPSQLIAVLEDIEAGRPVEPDVIEYFADDFGKVPPNVREALSFLVNERFEDSNALRIEDMELMTMIRDGKLNTRREVSQFFRNYQAEADRSSNRLPMEATRVLGQIARFNTLIKKLEKKLLSAPRPRGSSTPRPRSRRSKSYSDTK